MTTRSALARRLLIATAAAAVMGVLGLWWLGSQLVRPAPRAVPLPADFPARALTIPGTRIAAWWLDEGARAPAVLLLHPKRGDRSSMLSRARLLVRRGFSVALIDLQAHGETPGSAISFGWREAADVRSALAWLDREAPGRRVGVIGCSLGGAAVLLGPQPVGVDAVVLEAVYPRLRRAIENRLRLRLGGLAPLMTPFLLAQLGPRLHVSPAELEPIRSIARLGAPVLLVAGSRDQHTTP
ncbi:MAG: alpha/beta hydrolase, partial [Candidatus Rokuibacteriota bacterium]